MKTIQLHIPDDLASQVQNLGDDAETVIIEMLRSRITELSDRMLAKEYRMAAEEHNEIARDFTHVDTEGWDDEY